MTYSDLAGIEKKVNDMADLITGVSNYIVQAGVKVGMRNETLRLELLGVKQSISSLQQSENATQSLLTQLASHVGQQDGQIAILLASMQVVKAANLATQSQLEANSAADVLETSRLTKLESQATADKLADAARDAWQARTDAQLALFNARLGTDETAIQTAQARADEAKATAATAVNAAAAAQSKADADALAAKKAQDTADAATAAASTNATALTTLQADVATRLPTSVVRRGQVAVGAVTIAVLTPATVAVTFATPFADNNYEVFPTKGNGGLLNTELGWVSKTPAGFTLTLRNTGVASLTMPGGTADYFAIHN